MIRRVFNALSLRERLLTAFFIWAILLVLLDAFSGYFSRVQAQSEAVSSELEVQQEWFAQETLIDASMEAALERVDSSKTFSGAKLFEIVEGFANVVGLEQRSISPAGDEEGDIFTVHSVTATFRNADLDKLLVFDQLVQNQAPYIAIERATLTRNNTDPRQLSARYRISSFELKSRNIQ